MKIQDIAILLLFVTLIVKPAVAADQSTWSDANNKYQSGSFKSAIEFYEDIFKSGKETAALDYNLGNSYFKLGHKGKAIVFYERALKISPRDQDVRWNIDVVKSAITDKIEPADEDITRMFIRRIADKLAVNEVAMILSGLLILFLLFSFIGFMAPAVKTFTRGFSFLAAIFFVVTTVLFIFKWLDVKDPKVIILDKEVEARYGPSDRETKAFVLHEGAEARVIDESRDWFYLSLENKSSGWVPKKSCEVV